LFLGVYCIFSYVKIQNLKLKNKFKKNIIILIIKRMSKKSLKKVVSYLDKRRVFDTKKFNLQGLPGPNFGNGKFYIKSNDEFITFIKHYNEYCIKDNNRCYFLEPPFNINNLFNFDEAFIDHNVIKIDLDFKYNYDIELEKTDKDELLKHKYTKKQIKSIINLYFTELSKFVNLNDAIKFPTEYNSILEGLDVVLMERTSAYISIRRDKKTVKDGIHILIPEFVFPCVVLHKVRQLLLKNPKFIAIINEIEQENSITDVLDESVISKNAWFLYGSGKPSSEPYLITQVYKFKENKDEHYKFNKIKDLKNYTKNSEHIIHKLSNFGVKQTVLPLDNALIERLKSEFSALSSQCDKNDKDKFNQILGIKNEINYKDIVSGQPETPTITLDFLNKILSCFKPQRTENYEDWWKIGQALYNIDWQKGFTAFIGFSKKCPDKFDLEVCKDIWRLFQRNHMINKYQFNIKFLKDMAFLDNKVKYNKISDFITMQILNGIIDIFRQPEYAKKIGDSTFSKEIKNLIDSDNSMNFVSIEKNQWYYYDKHKWINDMEGNRIKLYIKNNILSIFKKYYNNCCEKNKGIQNDIDAIKTNEVHQEAQQNSINSMDDLLNSNINDLSEGITSLELGRQNIQEMILNQSIMEERIRVSLRLITYLEDSAKRSNLVKELATEFNDPNFYKILDTNQNVFLCNNGIFDLETCEFRDGVPDDMVTISSNNNYITDEVRYSDPEYQEYDEELNDFINKIFPNREMREYMLDLWALAISGKTILQTFNVCTGTGSNGKSVNFELLSEVFGDYYCTASPALLTKSRNDANSASPALAVLIGKRIICTEEPDENENIKTGVMKDAVSGTPISCRELHKPQKTFIPQYMMFFNCNDKPDIESTDDGTWRRIRVSPYISKFCDFDDIRLNNPKFKHHYAKESTIKGKFCHWKEVFLNELFRRFKKLKENNFKIILPELVQKAIDDYKSGHNIYEMFKRNCLTKTSGEKLTIIDAFDAFKQNADQCNQRIRNINRNTFQTEISRVLGPLKGRNGTKYWKDWSIIESYGDDDEENDESESDTE